MVDVIIFGSFARSKSLPNDIDLCILINEVDESKSLDLVDSLSKTLGEFSLKFQINILTEKDFISGKNSLAHALLSEGISLDGMPLSKSLGYEPNTLFLYSLKEFSSSDRVRFHYLLAGRNSDGILKQVKGESLGGGVISIPTIAEDMIIEIFKAWKVEFKTKRVLMES